MPSTKVPDISKSGTKKPRVSRPDISKSSKPKVSKDDAVPSGRTILPGEPGQSKPSRPGSKPRPMPVDPKPVNRYRAMKRSLRTPGMQDGEKEQLQRIAEHRGVSMKEARAIAIKRTAKGRSLKGLPGPKGNASEGGRRNITNAVAVRDIRKPGSPVNGTAPGEGPKPGPETPISSSRMGGRRPVPKRPTRGVK